MSQALPLAGNQPLGLKSAGQRVRLERTRSCDEHVHTPLLRCNAHSDDDDITLEKLGKGTKRKARIGKIRVKVRSRRPILRSGSSIFVRNDPTRLLSPLQKKREKKTSVHTTNRGFSAYEYSR